MKKRPKNYDYSQDEAVFCLNKNGCYFKVQSGIDTSKLDGVTIFSSLDGLYAAVCEAHDLTLDEVESSEILIRGLTEIDMRGCPCDIVLDDTCPTIEKFINEYEI